MRTTCLTHLIGDAIILIIFGDKYKYEGRYVFVSTFLSLHLSYIGRKIAASFVDRYK
jgi:hypothetical protein